MYYVAKAAPCLATLYCHVFVFPVLRLMSFLLHLSYGHAVFFYTIAAVTLVKRLLKANIMTNIRALTVVWVCFGRCHTA